MRTSLVACSRSSSPASVRTPRPRRSVEQARAKLLLEALDRLADRRLGAVKAMSGLGEAALVRHGQENVQIW